MVETRILSVGNILPNAYNANEMTDPVFDHLTETIESFGFLQNVLVWEKSETEYVLIDGEHRWKALSKLGTKEIEAKVLTTRDLFNIGFKLKEQGKINFDLIPSKEQEVVPRIAQVLTILMNQIKGENNPLKLAKIYEDLNLTFSVEELNNLLKISEQELISYRSLLQMSEDELESLNKGKGEFGDGDSLNVIKLILDETQSQIVSKSISAVGISSPTNAIVEICKIYLDKMGVSYESDLEVEE